MCVAVGLSMNTKVKVEGVKTLDKVAFYMASETAIVPMFAKLFPESVGKFSIDVEDQRQLDVLNREIGSVILSVAEQQNVNISMNYAKQLKAHFMNRIVFYNTEDILFMNSMYTPHFMTHYQMYRYLSEWILAKKNLFAGLDNIQFSKEVLNHARNTNNTLLCPIADRALIEICQTVGDEYFPDVQNQDVEVASKIKVHLLVPDYEYNVIHPKYPIDGFNDEYIDWAFSYAKSNGAVEHIEQEMIRNNTTYRDLGSAIFYLQNYLEQEYWKLPFTARMAYKRRFTLATHMILSDYIRFDQRGYMSILSPENGYSKLKSKNIPQFLYLRCCDDRLLKSYATPKSEVFRDMVRLKLIEFNMLRQQPLDSKLMKKHFDATMKMLLDTSSKNVIPMAFKLDEKILSSMVARVKKAQGRKK